MQPLPIQYRLNKINTKVISQEAMRTSGLRMELQAISEQLDPHDDMTQINKLQDFITFLESKPRIQCRQVAKRIEDIFPSSVTHGEQE